MTNYLFDVTPTMNDMKNYNVVFFNPIDDDVASDGDASQSCA